MRIIRPTRRGAYEIRSVYIALTLKRKAEKKEGKR